MTSARGYDVSDYQGSIPADAEFVFVKASEGAHTEQSGYAAKVADARSRGITLGHYHFLHAENAVGDEVAHFLRVVGDVPAGELLALDFEPYGQGVDDAAATAAKNAWLAAVKAAHPDRLVGLYANLDWWHRTDDNAGDFLWIADYDSPAGSPAVEHPWAFHQYTESPLDTDAFNGSADDLRAWAGAAAAPAPPPPAAEPQWRTLVDHVLAVPEQVYETWVSGEGWNNITRFGAEYGENGVSWCVEFDWDMFHDVGLDGVVPKTDNVSDFANWARSNGQWSEYPSVGAWVDFGDGAHTEIVTGFDADTVHTKGGNSIQAGATDNGQGNGVWSHTHARRDPYVTGYFAPRFPDGVCPPTADPADPRGGAAVASWTPGGPAAPADPDAFPGASSFGPGARNDYVTRLGRMLVARGGSRFYTVGPGPQWGPADQAATAAFQRAQGWTGSDADGVPGPDTWHLLVTGGGSDIPPALTAPPFPGRQYFEPGQVNDYVTQLGRQLVAKGFGRHYSVGPGPAWGPADRANVHDFQLSRPDLSGDADGFPGPRTRADLFA